MLIGQQVTVVGAGIAGLAVARALALRGADVTVLEQADAIREVGAGLQVSPNGARVLQALGLTLDGVRAAAVELRDGLDDRLVTGLEVGRLRPDQDYHFVHRADLISLLLAGAVAAGVRMQLLSRVAAIDLTGTRPVLRMEDESAVEAGLLIGADGLHSRLRGALNGPSAPVFTGQVAWRAIIPGDRGPALAEVHMGPGRHLVSYPLRDGTLRNIVAVEERRAWAAESWSLRDDPMELQLAFKTFSPRVRGWLDQVQDVHLWGLFRHPVAAVWQRVLPGGAAAILGDAAHPTLPFLAQGASMGLEDAWVLAASLASHDTMSAGLAAYQQARAARSARIVNAAARNARAYHLGGMPRLVAHAVLRFGGWLAPDLALRRFDWLYGFDATL
ncbi:MAG: FAD-dependent monooxygenase [Candidatus Saccharibacteria bacterium]|nr:FAD-dependent monooxygenase [Pseudorhodobacter sp.]